MDHNRNHLETIKSDFSNSIAKNAVGDVDRSGIPAICRNPEILNSLLSANDAEEYGRNWVIYLGAQNKSGIPLDCVPGYLHKDIEQVRAECLKIASMPSSSFTQDEIYAVVCVFCNREECAFDYDWVYILEVLTSLNCSLDQFFNIFHAIVTKFIPRRTNGNSICYQLMHLILQYHEPKLSCFLESYKIPAIEYARVYFSTLFARTLKRDVLYRVWNKYFEKGDPFLLFAMMLVFIMNSSEELLKLNNREKMLEVLQSTSYEMCLDDTNDFLELSFHFLNQTPSSVKQIGLLQDFQRSLFGSPGDNENSSSVRELLALPIDARDVLRMCVDENVQDGISFFTIDARSHAQYSVGHLAGSYNLDTSLFVDEPNKYNMALSSLDAYRNASHPEDHLLFLGSGHQDIDLYLNMVIANFLQNERKHIAVVDGGYKALHVQMSPNFDRLEGHSSTKCLECYKTGTQQFAAQTRTSSWKKGINIVFDAMRARTPSITEGMRRLRLGSSGASDSEKTGFSHVNTSERHGKRYRNERSIFTLSDSDSENDAAFTSSNLEHEPKKKLDEILAQKNVIDHFDGMEVWSDGSGSHNVKCSLVLTESHIVIYHHTNTPNEVISRGKHSYSSVVRIATRKNNPEMITFKFGYPTSDGDYKITKVHRFFLEKAGDCAKVVKTSIFNMWPEVLG